MAVVTERAPWYNKYVVEQVELPIPCFRCGVCCYRYHVQVNLIEARRIADGLRLTWGDFQNRCLERHWPGVDTFLLRQNGGACVFLKHAEGSKQTSCLVHAFKPTSCRDWTPSVYRRECQEGLAKYWGLQAGPSGELRGSKGKIERFQSLLARCL